MAEGVWTILNRVRIYWSTNTMEEITRSKIQAIKASKADCLEKANDNFARTIEATSFDTFNGDIVRKNLLFTSETELKEFLYLVCESEPASLYHRKLADDSLNKNTFRNFIKQVENDTPLLPATAVICVFLDELNTANCLGMVSETFLSHSLDGIQLPPNIFFCGASMLIVTTLF